MFTPCCPSAGPTGGAGVACPPGHWSFTFAVITLAIAVRFLFQRRSILRLNPFHLPVFQVHRRGPVEDDEHDFHKTARLDDFLDRPLEVLERAVLDLDPVAALDRDANPRGLLGPG